MLGYIKLSKLKEKLDQLRDVDKRNDRKEFGKKFSDDFDDGWDACIETIEQDLDILEIPEK